MPNTPALVLTGATALHANPKVNEEQKDLAENILRSVGLTLWVEDEGKIGCGDRRFRQRPRLLFSVDGGDGKGRSGIGAG